ncbi:MAG: MaoC family dehydratase [Dongiaceae bacterium]
MSATAKASAGKASAGRLFEDFRVGQSFAHPVPRTVGAADAALYLAITGARFPLHCAEPVARALGLPGCPLDDMLVFNLVFGRSVIDISWNGVATLGYADCRFGVPVMAGDTLTARSTVIGLRESSNRRTGTVYVRTTGTNQRGETVLDYARWVLVKKRDEASPAPDAAVPSLPEGVPASAIAVPAGLDAARYDTGWSGAAALWEDYQPGERIDHVEGVTLEESDHMMATRLYQNGARLHFNQHSERHSRFGRRVVYGGHVISVARALSANGLGNALRLAAIHGGRHAAPSFAGDTLYAWSEVLAREALPGRDDLGLLRLRTVALKNQDAARFTLADAAGALDPSVVLTLDYSVLMPRRAG